jgi:hypothetical protein
VPVLVLVLVLVLEAAATAAAVNAVAASAIAGRSAINSHAATSMGRQAVAVAMAVPTRHLPGQIRVSQTRCAPVLT